PAMPPTCGHRTGFVLLSLVFGVLRLIGAETPSAGLSVSEDATSITVACGGALPWKAVVDRARGGVISAFHLPAGGPDLLPNDHGADGKVVSHFRGLFNAFYGTRPKDPKAKNPRGTLWLQPGDRCKLSVLKRAAEEVVVEVKGSAFGWARIVPAEE